METNKAKLLSKVASYYTDKFAHYGETPRGVDWNGEESQTLRFQQLCKIIVKPEAFSLNDLGCGYGALFDFLNKHYLSFSYLGVDLSAELIRAAMQRYKNFSQARFIASAEPDCLADYTVASGIFNVRLDHPESQWRKHLEDTLEVLHRNSRLGFAFNCLTSYSDKEKMQEYLYYADPCLLFDLCKRRYSRQVALLHDYGLYEFTILVRKA